jgi:hypothetical protein
MSLSRCFIAAKINILCTLKYKRLGIISSFFVLKSCSRYTCNIVFEHLRCDAVYSGGSLPAFRRKVLPQSKHLALMFRGLHFDPEDGDNTSFRSVVKLLSEYTASYSRSQLCEKLRPHLITKVRNVCYFATMNMFYRKMYTHCRSCSECCVASHRCHQMRQ